MRHEEMLELMSLALDGELSPEEQARLERHLRECEECQETYEALCEIQNALGELEDVEVPQGFVERVMEQVRGEKAAPKAVPFWRRPQGKALAGLAACAAICVGLYYGTRGGGAGIETLQQSVGLQENGSQNTQEERVQSSSPYAAPEPAAEPPAAQTEEEPMPSDVAGEPRTDRETQAPAAPDSAMAPQPIQPAQPSGPAMQERDVIQPANAVGSQPAVQNQSKVVCGALVLDTLPEGAAGLLPPLEEWTMDESGRMSCPVTQEVFEQVRQLAEQTGGQYTMVPGSASGTFSIQLNQSSKE